MKTILVVDDELQVLSWVTELLRMQLARLAMAPSISDVDVLRSHEAALPQHRQHRLAPCDVLPECRPVGQISRCDAGLGQRQARGFRPQFRLLAPLCLGPGTLEHLALGR